MKIYYAVKNVDLNKTVLKRNDIVSNLIYNSLKSVVKGVFHSKQGIPSERIWVFCWDAEVDSLFIKLNSSLSFTSTLPGRTNINNKNNEVTVVAKLEQNLQTQVKLIENFEE